jgi:hypothetical protein
MENIEKTESQDDLRREKPFDYAQAEKISPYEMASR